MAKQTTRAVRRRDGFRRAICLVRDVCNLAGVPSLIEDARVDLARAGVLEAIRRHDNAPVFDWLMESISYQGVSDAVAYSFMESHGRIRHDQVERVCSNPNVQNFKAGGILRTAATARPHGLATSKSS